MPSPSPSNVSNHAQKLWLERTLHGWQSGRRCLQIIAAVGAEFVGLGDFALALRAGGMQVAFAVWAEIETRADCRRAARTGIRQRLAHQEIDDYSEKGEGPGKKQGQ